MNHAIEITGGVLQQECSEKLSAFFQKRRVQQKEAKLAQQLMTEAKSDD